MIIALVAITFLRKPWVVKGSAINLVDFSTIEAWPDERHCVASGFSGKFVFNAHPWCNRKSNQSAAIELGSRDNSSGGLGATGLSGA
jgi:hypothetical protein